MAELNSGIIALKADVYVFKATKKCATLNRYLIIRAYKPFKSFASGPTSKVLAPGSFTKWTS